MKTLLTIGSMLALLAGVATAETHTWSNPDAPFNETIPVDMAADFVGITSVDVHMSGFGGGQNGWCTYPEGSYPVYLPFSITVTADVVPVAPSSWSAIKALYQ